MSSSRSKIIYVDDIGFGLMTVGNKLKNRYEVLSAQSPDALFKILEKDKPNIILVNVKVPEVDGYDVIKKLRENNQNANIPVVFITSKSNSDANTAEKCKSLGAAAHVSKPFSTVLLIETIESVLKSTDVAERKPCILAVDDVVSILKAIHYALRDKYKVYVLSNPEELKDILLKVKPDLFLLDYKMPVLSGFELVPIIREFPEHKETPIIFLSSEGKEDYVAEAQELGACDYIKKPFEPNVLREVIKKHVR